MPGSYPHQSQSHPQQAQSYPQLRQSYPQQRQSYLQQQQPQSQSQYGNSNYTSLGSLNQPPALGAAPSVDMAQFQKYDGKKRAAPGSQQPGRERPPVPKRPRFQDDYDDIPVKDDSKIPVDKTLIDKRFNFWNLPSTAKVLLVSNVPLEIAQPRAIFHLFSFYGDVNRVKILPHKLNVALVEFRTATMACIARNFLDQVQVKDHKLVVSFSKFGEIRMPENPSEAGFTEDFRGPEFRVLQRYAKDEIMSVNLKRLCKPSSCLHINNMPQGFSADKVKQLFVNAGVSVLDIIAVRKKKERESPPNAPSRAMVFVQVKNQSDALIGMALLGGSAACPAVPAGFRISFSETTVKTEREKVLNNAKMEVAAHNQPL